MKSGQGHSNIPVTFEFSNSNSDPSLPLTMIQKYSIFPSCPHSSHNCRLIVLHVLHKKPTPGCQQPAPSGQRKQLGFLALNVALNSGCWERPVELSLADVRTPRRGRLRKCRADRGRDEGRRLCCVAGVLGESLASRGLYSSAEDDAGLS